MGKRTNENGLYWRWLDDCSAQIIRMHWLRTMTLAGASRELDVSPDQLRRIIRRLQARGLLADIPVDLRSPDGKPVEDADKADGDEEGGDEDGDAEATKDGEDVPNG